MPRTEKRLTPVRITYIARPIDEAALQTIRAHLMTTGMYRDKVPLSDCIRYALNTAEESIRAYEACNRLTAVVRPAEHR